MEICNAISDEGVDNFTFYVIETCEDDVVNEREIYWIDKFNSYYEGYNNTLGGSGAIRDIYQLNDNRIKPVSCYTLDGKHIQDYDSRGIASAELGVNKSCITACIKGTTFQAGGYRWSWKDGDLVDKKARVNKRGKIYGMKKSGETMCWNSQADCAEFIEGNRSANNGVFLSINSPDDNKLQLKGWYIWRVGIPENWCAAERNKFTSETARKGERKKRPVKATCLKTGRIYEFESVLSAANELNLTTGNIFRGLEKGWKCGGYIWEDISSET